MSFKPTTFSVLLTGIGGQGIMLISKAIADAAFRSYPFACRTESRGLSQRGGSVRSEVRFGISPLAPVIGAGTADLIISTDALEAVRTLPHLRHNGRLLTNAAFTLPAYLSEPWCNHETDGQRCKMDAQLAQALADSNIQCFNLLELTGRSNSEKAQNTVILGIASRYLPLSPHALRAALLALIQPEQREGNAAAFAVGRSIVALSKTEWSQDADMGQPVTTALSA
jgi:indolepyruvate ferredoxin oxidoreductase beta subunit